MLLKKQGWQNRTRAGVKGGKAIEYNANSLPVGSESGVIAETRRLKQAWGILKSPAPRWKPMIMIVRHCGANGITPAIPSADLLKNGCLRFRLQTKC
jgi:hypothetical protein